MLLKLKAFEPNEANSTHSPELWGIVRNCEMLQWAGSDFAVRQFVEGNFDRRTAFCILHSSLRSLCHAVSSVFMFSDNKMELNILVGVKW
jgi:hypothetical protein